MGMLCSTADVSTLLQRSFTPSEDAAVALILDLMQGELEMITNRPLGPKVITGEIARRVGDQVFLNKTPVISVQSVTSVGSSTLVDATTYKVRPWGLLMGGSALDDAFAPLEWESQGLEYQDAEYKVNYTAGLSTADWRYQGAKSLLMSRAIRVINKAADDAIGVDRLTQEGYAASYMAEGWTEQELKTAKRLKKRTVAR